LALAFALFCLALLLQAPARGQLIPGTVISADVVPITATPVGITCLDLGTGGATALIQTLGAAIRFTLNAETPNTSTSYLLQDGSFFAVGNPPGFRAIRAAGVNASLKVTCIGR
jgi:hypothetical protein